MQVLTVTPTPTSLDFGSGALGSAGSSQSVLATVLAAATDFPASVAGEASGDYTISSSCPSSTSDYTWTAAATQPSDTRITALAVSPGASNVLYAGTASGTVFRNSPSSPSSSGIPLLLLQE